MASPERLNVTITRARRHLLLLGSAPALMASPRWAELLSEAAPLPACFFTGAPQPPPPVEAEAEAAAEREKEAAEEDEEEPQQAEARPSVAGASAGGHPHAARGLEDDDEDYELDTTQALDLLQWG